MARLWNRKDWSLRLSQERGHVAEGAAWVGYGFWGVACGSAAVQSQPEPFGELEQ